MLNIVKNHLERRSRLIKASRENGKIKKRTTEVMGSVASVLGISTLASNTSNAVEKSNGGNCVLESSTNRPVKRLNNGDNVNTTQVEETSIKRQSKLIISKVENNKIIVARKINTTQKSVKFIKSYSNNDTTNPGGKTTPEESAVSSTVPHDPAVEESTALKKISNDVAVADSDTAGLKNTVTKYRNSEKIIDLGESSDSESTIVLSYDLNKSKNRKNKKTKKSNNCSSENPKRVLTNFSKNLNGRSALSVHKKFNKSETVKSSSKLADKKNNKSQDIYADDSDLTVMFMADEPNKSQNIIKNEINDAYVGDSDSTLVLTPDEQNQSQSIDKNKVNTCLGGSDSSLTLTPDEPNNSQNIIKNKVNDIYKGDSDMTVILTPPEECENRKKITNKTKESTEPPKKESKNSGTWKNVTSQSTKTEAPCALSSQEFKDKISRTFRDGSVNLSGLSAHELEEKLSEIIGDGGSSQLEPQSHLLTQENVLKSSQNDDSADKSDKNNSLEETLKLNETLDIRELDDTLKLSQTNESTDSSLIHLNYQSYNENSDDELTDSSLGRLIIDESLDKTIDSMDPLDISNIDQNNDSLDNKEDSPDVSTKSFRSNIKLKRLEKKRELVIRIERLDVAGLIEKPSNLCMQKELRVRLERLPFVNKKITPIKAKGKTRKSPDQKLLKKNKNKMTKNKNGVSELETSLKIAKIVLTPINFNDYPNLRNFQTDSPINCSNFKSSTVDKKLTKNNSTTIGNKSKILGRKKQSESTATSTRKRLAYKSTLDKSNSIEKKRRPNLKSAIKKVNSVANNNSNVNLQLKKQLRVNLVRLCMDDLVLWQSNVQKQINKIFFKGIKSKMHEKMIRKLGGVITDNPTTATVLIADKISKTHDFISALIRGIPIVSIDWLRMSIKKNRFIEPTEYLLVDVKPEKMLNFNFKKILMRSRETSLLKDYFFVITPNVSLLSTDKLTSLIESAGGKVLPRVPELLINEKIFIVCCKKDIRRFEKLYVDRRVEIVTAEFIIDSLLKQEFRFEGPSL